MGFSKKLVMRANSKFERICVAVTFRFVSIGAQSSIARTGLLVFRVIQILSIFRIKDEIKLDNRPTFCYYQKSSY
jgi:hypothetical protein